MQRVTFKSTPENFRKEAIGLKQCTVRYFDNDTDERKKLLDAYVNGDIAFLEIYIESKGEDTATMFTRFLITDVTILCVQNLGTVYIISWNFHAVSDPNL